MVSLDVGSLREKQAFDSGMQGLDELESEL